MTRDEFDTLLEQLRTTNIAPAFRLEISDALHNEHIAQQAKIDALTKALKEYADGDNWTDSEHATVDYIWMGGGNGYDIARAALESVK